MYCVLSNTTKCCSARGAGVSPPAGAGGDATGAKSPLMNAGLGVASAAQWAPTLTASTDSAPARAQRAATMMAQGRG